MSVPIVALAIHSGEIVTLVVIAMLVEYSDTRDHARVSSRGLNCRLVDPVDINNCAVGDGVIQNRCHSTWKLGSSGNLCGVMISTVMPIRSPYLLCLKPFDYWYTCAVRRR